MLSVARLTATRALTKTCPRAAAASVGSRNMVGFADSMKSKVRSPFDAGTCLPSRGIFVRIRTPMYNADVKPGR